MSESLPPDTSVADGSDPAAALDALRQQGADRFDPVRFRFLEALARRAVAQRGGARRVVDAKLAKAIAQYAEHFAQAQDAAGRTLACAVERFPSAADDLRRLHSVGDFIGLDRCVASLVGPDGSTALGDLLGQLAQPVSEMAGESPAPAVGTDAAPRAELKSLRYFRNTWSQLSVDQQLAQALAQAPKNAGPLNSQLLVLRSLKLMRDISPGYLSRFMSYVDTLLWFDQAYGSGTPAPAARSESEKKRKPGRGKSA